VDNGNTYYDPGSGYALCVRDCKVYLTGAFLSMGVSGGPSGIQANNIARTVPGSGTWATLGTGLTYQGDPLSAYGQYITANQITDIYHVYVVGGFDAAGGVSSQNVAFWGISPQ
jgi:hypothetical protein